MIAFGISLAGATPNDPLVEWLSRAGALGILALAVVSFVRGWIVSGKSYERALEERDRALELVYRQAELAERLARLAEKTV